MNLSSVFWHLKLKIRRHSCTIVKRDVEDASPEEMLCDFDDDHSDRELDRDDVGI